MSLKKCVVALFIVNLIYFIYSQSWFESMIGADASQREPERLKKQINSEAIRISVVNPTTTAAPMPATVCPAITPERWIVYMGPYTTTALRDSKIAELQRLRIPAEIISKPSLKIGLSLGEHADETSARSALAALGEQGVKTATILLWQASANADTATTGC